MWHYSWFRILILILCLILAFLVGVSIKGTGSLLSNKNKRERR